MVTRLLEPALLARMQMAPAVAVVGPRQVGKTTLVRVIQAELRTSSLYLDLERPSDVARLQQAELFLGTVADQTVVLDEVQRMPDLFPLLRSLIDDDRRPGRFILLGSASPELLRRASESLAGRISYLEMHPFLLPEVGAERVIEHWVRGGFPGSYLTDDEPVRRQWLLDFVTSYLERDLPLLGLSAAPTLTRRLLTMLAGQQGGLLNQSALAASLGITAPTVGAYLDFLEHAFLIRRLPPYFVNVGKRLTKTPKAYVRDSGLLHHLLGIRDQVGLLGHLVAGGSWEGYVVQEVVAQVPAGVTPYFYRTADGAELDLILEQNGRVALAVEVKLSDAAKLSKGTSVALADLGNPPLLVVTPSGSVYPMRSGVWACGAGNLAAQLRKFLV